MWKSTHLTDLKNAFLRKQTKKKKKALEHGEIAPHTELNRLPKAPGDVRTHPERNDKGQTKPSSKTKGRLNSRCPRE